MASEYLRTKGQFQTLVRMCGEPALDSLGSMHQRQREQCSCYSKSMVSLRSFTRSPCPASNTQTPLLWLRSLSCCYDDHRMRRSCHEHPDSKRDFIDMVTSVAAHFSPRFLCGLLSVVSTSFLSRLPARPHPASSCSGIKRSCDSLVWRETKILKRTRMFNLLNRTIPVVALTFGLTACDAQDSQKVQESADQDLQVEALADSTKASELAVRVSHCAGNHCAFNMGSCLRDAVECGDGDNCNADYAACSDAFIATACETESTVELPAAMACWTTFQDCMTDGAGAESCLQDLHACAQEGCGERGCDTNTTDLALNFPVEIDDAAAPCPASEELRRWWPRPKFPKFPGGTLPGKHFPKFPKYPGSKIPGKHFPKFPKYPGSKIPGKHFPKFPKYPGGGWQG